MKIIKLQSGHSRFYWLRALGLLYFFLEYSLEISLGTPTLSALTLAKRLIGA